MRLTILLLLLLSSLAIVAQSMKVMSYNIRYDTPKDGVNAWPNRINKVTTVIKNYDPDIIGVQEALHHQLTDITKQLSSYSIIGVGRDDGKQQGEFSAILLNKNRFEIIEQNTFWLSETPDVPGSKSWDAAITRVVTWALLTDRETKRNFLFVNTHFDHIGKEARKQSAALLKDKISALTFDVPVVVTGDFNCTPEEEPYALLTNGEGIELIDSASEPIPTCCGFDLDVNEPRTIDHIFHTNEWRADQYKVIQDNDGKYFPSDHLPVMISLSLTD